MILRPVLEGCMTLGDLLDPRVTLDHVAMLNDALDVRYENERRAVERDG